MPRKTCIVILIYDSTSCKQNNFKKRYYLVLCFAIISYFAAQFSDNMKISFVDSYTQNNISNGCLEESETVMFAK